MKKDINKYENIKCIILLFSFLFFLFVIFYYSSDLLYEWNSNQKYAFLKK